MIPICYTYFRCEHHEREKEEEEEAKNANSEKLSTRIQPLHGFFFLFFQVIQLSIDVLLQSERK